MYEANLQVASAVKAILPVVLALEPGEMIRYSEMETLGHIKRNETQFRSVCQKIIIKARQAGVVLRAVNSVGYRFLPPDEVAEGIVVYRSKRSSGQIRRGLKEVENYPMGSVPMHQRRVVMETAAYWEKQQIETRAVVQIVRKTETMPR